MQCGKRNPENAWGNWMYKRAFTSSNLKVRKVECGENKNDAENILQDTKVEVV